MSQPRQKIASRPKLKKTTQLNLTQVKYLCDYAQIRLDTSLSTRLAITLFRQGQVVTQVKLDTPLPPTLGQMPIFRDLSQTKQQLTNLSRSSLKCENLSEKMNKSDLTYSAKIDKNNLRSPSHSLVHYISKSQTYLKFKNQCEIK